MARSKIMRDKWLEMLDAFSALTPEQRKAEAEQRFDESLERMAKERTETRELASQIRRDKYLLKILGS